MLIPNQSLRKQHLAFKKKVKIIACTVLESPYVEEIVESKSGTCKSGHYCQIPNYDDNGKVTSWRRGCCIGYAIEIFNMVKKKLGFEYELYAVDRFGSYTNGSWNGMVGELVEGRADFALQALSIYSKRQSAVDFTSYMLTSSYGMVRTTQDQTQEGKSALDWNFIIVLSPLLATAILLSTLIAVLMTFVLENTLNWVFKEGGGKKGSVYFPIREVLTYIVGLLFQRDMGGTNPRRWSGRFVALGYAGAMTVVMSAYTARITVSSISKVEKDNFKGFYSDEVSRSNSIMK